jgi:hypothetical protein
MTIPEPATSGDLKSVFCERFGCSPSDFEERAFGKCLYFPAKVIAPLLQLMDPDWFARDRGLIRNLGNATSWQQVMAELDAFHYREHLQRSYARTVLHLRVSARKANKMAATLFPPQKASG